MLHGDIAEEYLDALPGDLPAVWVTEGDHTTLYLRADLPPELVTRLRAMCIDALVDAA